MDRDAMQINLALVVLLAVQVAGCASARPLPSLAGSGGLAQVQVRVDCSGILHSGTPVFCSALEQDLLALGATPVERDGQLDVVATRSEIRGLSNFFEVDVRANGRLLEHASFDGSRDCGEGGWDNIDRTIMPCFARLLANQLAGSSKVAALVADERRERDEQRSRPANVAIQNPPTQTAAPLAARSAASMNGKLAVLDLRNFTTDLTKQNASYFTDVVRQETLRKQPQLDVMTRENLLVLIQATGKRLDECEGECEVDTGRRIGADLIVSGEIQKVGTHYKISLRLHETKEGRLLGSAIASGSSIDELDEHTAQAADELYATVR